MVPETINSTLSTETNFLASCKVLTGGGREGKGGQYSE